MSRSRLAIALVAPRVLRSMRRAVAMSRAPLMRELPRRLCTAPDRFLVSVEVACRNHRQVVLVLNFSGFCRSLTVLKTRIVEPKLGLGRERWSVSQRGAA